ncbi:hypothetical protein [Dechloromonas denitrificans]|uniref:hypothetical protein n=1 Tax=Dechloromonas denitrificans TaxID=281362 RepID=UPI001CF8DCA9|nr:hypothetical protein [Dechloromonas denitrificans]
MMKAKKLLLALLVLGFAGIGGALAHGVRGQVGVYVNPFWGYPPPFYYPPQVIVVRPSPPPVYVEQYEAPAEPAAAAQQYWYYCAAAKGYYPYVQECPGGWQKVLPQPAR